MNLTSVGKEVWKAYEGLMDGVISVLISLFVQFFLNFKFMKDDFRIFSARSKYNNTNIHITVDPFLEANLMNPSYVYIRMK